MARDGRAGNDRWAARPWLGAALRVLALLGPIAVGLGVALLLARLVPEPTGGSALVGWWALVLGGSAAAVYAADRVARRLLPLAILLELSLIFPDKAPSRMRAARTSSVRDIDQRLARLRGAGVQMRPYEAAETVVTLVGILGLHDKRTRGHSERVRAFTDMLTAELGFDDDDRMRLRWAALVHDLGKLTVPASVLNSAGKLDEQGWELMHKHPEEGVRLLAGLLPWLGEWGDAVGEHHERWDGTGYPRGLAGEQISLAARIVALADAFEVMTSARSYKTSRSAAWARAELTHCAGKQFDPALVRAFLGISIGRLRWVIGPVTWLAELPFVATADRAGQTVKVASVTALATGLLFGSTLHESPLPGPVPGGTVAAVETELEPLPSGSEEDAEVPGPGTSASTDVPRPAAAALGTRVLPTPTPTAGAAVSAPRAVARPGTAPRPATAPTAGPQTQAASQPPSQPRRAASPSFALPDAYHLTSRGMQPRPATKREIVPIPVGGVKRFDTRLGGPVELPAARDLVVYVRFATRQGNAKLAARLLDCTSQGCTELSQGLVTQDKRTIDHYQRYIIPLNRPLPQVERLPGGHVLRLELRVLEPGAKAPARLSVGGATTPARLRLDPAR